LEHVNFKLLDVSWASFDRFYQQIIKSDVSGIIGFGEGIKESIVVELIGKNISSGVDEFGVSRDNLIISDQEPATNHSRIKIPNNRNIQESHDAGEFLCNYELFHLNTIDSEISGFIHLPVQGETPDEKYLSLLKPTVLDIVNYNFPEIKNLY
jgi:pyrrolidone-carboxylate peptidase